MTIRIKKQLVEAIGYDKLGSYGILNKDEFRWHDRTEIDLAEYSVKKVQTLLDLFIAHRSIHGTGILIADCTNWIKAITGEGGSVSCRTVHHFCSLVTLLLNKAPKHWLYKKDEHRDVWHSYYVSEVEFHPARKERDDYYPAYTELTLIWTEFGGRHQVHEHFRAENCVGITPEEALGRQGYIIETDSLLKEYEDRRTRFHENVGNIGKQFFAVGKATDDVDGNNKNEDRWYWRRRNSIDLDKSGEPARVVIDMFFEDEKESERRHDIYIDRRFWIRRRTKKDKDEEEEEDVDWENIPEPEIPLHPMFACFDMRRHMRLRIDVGQLTEYVYDPHLGDKLILPSDSRNLVEMLLAHKGGFKDIIAGKGGGSIILCAGIPGTGKTLTAEVYAEVMARPLYSVQASQLGTDPNELEDNLLKIFTRSTRWNAILLLDEADVYVASRGSDLTQNAIVGVFLRVLEYYRGVMFLTTNRADLVDDAIASRCVARIDYKAPDVPNQELIWHILAENAGIKITSDVIHAVAEKFTDLTGRDVKNLLKLAKLVSDSRGCEISLDVIRFVRRFKPTTDDGDNVKDTEEIHLPPIRTRIPVES